MVIVPKLGEGASTVINREEEEEVWKVAIKSRNIWSKLNVEYNQQGEDCTPWTLEIKQKWKEKKQNIARQDDLIQIYQHA